MNRYRKIDRLKANMAGILDIPIDVVLDMPRVTVIGSLQAYVENHQGIVFYDSNQIKLSFSEGLILVSGENLTIRVINSDEIIIDGSIGFINFEACDQNE